MDDVPTEDLEEWTNWSGNLQFEPGVIATPETEGQVQSLVEHCRAEGKTLRVVGAGHSWTPVVETDGVLVSLERLTGLVEHDREAGEAVIRGGTTLGEATAALQEVGLAMTNLGDVSLQTVAGAFGTGTHGTGTELQSLSSTLVGGRIVTGTGDVKAFSAEDDPEFLRAARLSLGTLGVFTELRLDLERAYKIERREYCTTAEEALEHVPTLAAENRHFDFYWYPRSDEVKLRLLNAPNGGTDERDLAFASLVKKGTGWWHQTIAEHDDMTRLFEEMEYAVPAEEGLECFREVRERIRENWRADVGWRVLWRTIAPEDTYLSAEYGRETVTIGILQNAQLEFREYFEDLEGVFRSYDGRPHWGKRHSLRAPELAKLYPEWDRFQEIRREHDPDGVFTSDYLRTLLEGAGVTAEEQPRRIGERESEVEGE
ncbi:D-arabinono-1,4-lactone oxidase [Natronobiforma cellulositropha]|uniref:D-arabinono-1,4-lactone oxidase n=1 Tax=Natronobiforma cellulositropha TaxID=1679076 RepID=UPI0021D5F694|nr:D-arabinono-1,4-lactone oxidase [Natronobiforma cellulositropha]